jgi:probable rRNA maturation factor
MLQAVFTNRQTDLSISRPRIVKAARIAADEKWTRGELSVVVVSGEEMCSLNLRHTGRVGQTDVLAFCLEDPDMPDDAVGEVIVNASLAAEEAERRGIDALDELMLYVVHGVLHMAGYDDQSTGDRRRMYAREKQVLGSLGIADIRNAVRKGGRNRKSQ